MAVLNSTDTLKNLRKKGFNESNRDHKFLELNHLGKLILHTKISHGGGHDLDNFLIKKMAEQCKLSKQEFIDLAKCPLSKEEYLKILKEKGLLD